MTKTLGQRPVVCIVTLCALYSAQGMPDGFVRTGLKTYLIDQGVSTASIGQMVALVSWPWALKWIWGPIIDRFGHHRMGRRRPWILAAQTGIGLTLATMLMIPDLSDSLRLLGIMIVMANVFASLQDVSVDAMAIDQLPENKRGVANGLMFGSSYFGSYLGAFLLGSLLLTSGIAAAVSVQLVLLFLIALFPFFFRERDSDAMLSLRFSDRENGDKPAPTTKQLLKQLARGFSVRSSWLTGILALSSLIAINAYLIVWPVYLQGQLGWSSEEYLRLEGGLSVWFGLSGAVIGGVIVSKLGNKRSVVVSGLLVAMTWFAHPLLATHWASTSCVVGLFLASTAFTGFFQVSMFSMFMSIAWRPIAATQFTAYMAMLNLSNGIGARMAGWLEQSFSMTTIFWIFGIYQLLGLGILLFIDPTQTRRILGQPQTPA